MVAIPNLTLLKHCGCTINSPHFSVETLSLPMLEEDSSLANLVAVLSAYPGQDQAAADERERERENKMADSACNFVTFQLMILSCVCLLKFHICTSDGK